MELFDDQCFLGRPGCLPPAFFEPYQDEYSNELRNLRTAPHTLHTPPDSGPDGASMTQVHPLPCFMHSVGVLAIRAVNERRKHIAIMRALGYRAMMIRAGFIIESVFVAVVGTVLGVILGAIVAWSFLDDASGQTTGLAFGIPWRNVSIVVAITIIAALVTTYIPARQASRIYPAEPLRFE